MGHSLRASGARILARMRTSCVSAVSAVGVAAICIGVSQGLPVVLENARASH